MLKATRKALEASIKSWEKHVAAGGGDEDAAECALCARFREGKNCRPFECRRKNENGRVLEVCPVAKASGKELCYGTPYWRWSLNPNLGDAKAELAFLKSLRPKL